MCVIIYIPKESSIDESEIRSAWRTNPDGAGYSIQKDGKVFFKRGFMNVNKYVEEIKPLIGNYNLLLHFRISTSKAVNKVQTHPYKKGNVTITEGSTTRPVICMNGVIRGQKEYLNCNDTMSYIIDHQQAFANINQDVLNIIQEATGAKWAVMLPDETLISSEFTYENGRFYSNRNHLWKSYYYDYGSRSTKKSFRNIIPGRNLRKSIRKDKDLYDDVCDFIELWCNNDYNMCNYCTKCLQRAKTLRDVKITLNENYYPQAIEDDCICEIEYPLDEDESICGIDFYDYETDYNSKTWFDERTEEYWNIFDE